MSESTGGLSSKPNQGNAVTTFNLRLSAVVLLGAAVFGIGVHLLHGYHVKRNADAFLREADRASEQNRPEIALQYLQRYVGLASDDLDVLVRYGSQLAELNESDAALRVFERVLRRDPDRHAARRRLVDLFIELERYIDASRQLERYLIERDPARRSPEDGKLLALQGRCLSALGRYDDAANSLRAAVLADTRNLHAYKQLSEVLFERLNASSEAVHHLDTAVKNNANDYRALVLRGEWIAEHADDPSVQKAFAGTEALSADAARDHLVQIAADDARKALQLAPDAPEAIVLAARCLSLLDRHDEARELIKRGQELAPKEPQVYSTAADIELQAGSRSGAIQWLDHGVAALPEDGDLRWNFASLLIESGKAPRAKGVIEELQRLQYSKAATEYLRARLLVSEQEWLSAAKRFERIRAQLGTSPDLAKQADYWSGVCYERIGHSDQGLASFRRAISVDWGWVPARLGLAEALVSAGRLQEAFDEYSLAASLPQAPLIAFICQARLQVLLTLQEDPDERNWKAATRALERLEQYAPDSPQVPILWAEVLAAQGDAAGARELLASAREKNLNAVELWIADIALARRTQDWHRTEELLEKAAEQLGDHFAIRLARAQCLLLRDGQKAASELYKLAEISHGWSREQSVQFAEGMAALFLAVRDFDGAEECCKLVADAQPKNLAIRLILLDLALQDQDQQLSRTEALLEEVRQIEGQGPLWRYGQAVRLSILAQQRQSPELLKEAVQHLAEARIARPAWAKVPRLLGQIYERQGELASAIEAYKSAVELGERNPVVVGRAVTLLFEQQRFVEADQIVRRLQTQQTPFSSELSRLAAEVSFELANFERALEMAREAAAGSEDYEDHIWLGRVLGILGRLSEAEEELRRAVDLAKDQTAPWTSLVQFLARSGRQEEAEATIDEAREHIAPDQVTSAVAECYEFVGKPDEAERHYRAALLEGEWPEARRQLADYYVRSRMLAEAEEQLRALLADAPRLGHEDRAWCRRNLALVLLTRAEGRASDEAMRLVEQNLATPTASLADRKTKAVILARQPHPGARSEAIGILEELFASGPSPSAEDRFLLAQLYLADGNWSKGSESIRRALAAAPNEPRYVRAYAQALLDRGEVSEAELWLDRLQHIAAGQPATIHLESAILATRGMFTESVELIRRAAAGDEVQGSARAPQNSLLLWYADRLEGFAREFKRRQQAVDAEPFLREAENLYAIYVRENHSDQLVLAPFLLRWGEVNRALHVLEATERGASPEQIASFTASVLGSGEATDQELMGLQSIVDRAVQESGQAMPLLIASADLQSWRGNLEEAEALYRDALRRDSQNPVALNNLALLLALGRDRGQDALELVQRAIEASGGNSALLDTRGVIRLSLGDARGAARDIQRAIEDRATAERYFHLAQAALGLGETAAAARAAARARELGLSLAQLHPLERPALQRLQVSVR